MSSPWTEPGRGLFSISVAAELTGLHPQTLRLYEQEGLLLPARSSGGTRRYSTDDIDRLHQIMALTSDGVNLAGIRHILELQAETRLLQAEVDRLTAAARNRPDRRTRPAQPARPERRDKLK
jgi:MerR family transcriptional regulator/heat shock protein HspR